MLKTTLNNRKRLSLKQKTCLISTGICLAASIMPSHAMDDERNNARTPITRKQYLDLKNAGAPNIKAEATTQINPKAQYYKEDGEEISKGHYNSLRKRDKPRFKEPKNHYIMRYYIQQ